MNTKKCNKCLEHKFLNNFYTRTQRGKTYLSVNCKDCDKKRISTFYYSHNKSRKSICVNYKGGKCMTCGYCKCLSALEFHHRNPEEKDPSIKQFSKGNFTERIKKELDKCDLLCANCHRELHDLENSNGRKPA